MGRETLRAGQAAIILGLAVMAAVPSVLAASAASLPLAGTPGDGVLGACVADHAPITITGDLEFTAENGVVRGRGTQDDPYVIEGWRIDPNGSWAITIAWTNAYVVLQDLCIEPAVPWTGGAVSLWHVSHATFNRVEVVRTGPAVRLEQVADLAFTENKFLQTGRNDTVGAGGIEAWAASNLSIVGNRFTGNRGISASSVRVFSGDGLTVSGNLFSGNTKGDVVHAALTNHTVISDNILTENTGSFRTLLTVTDSRDVEIARNVATGNWGRYGGAASANVWRSTDVDITGNVITGNIMEGGMAAGLSVWQSTSVLVANNTIVGETLRGGAASALGVWDSESVLVTGNCVAGNSIGGGAAGAILLFGVAGSQGLAVTVVRNTVEWNVLEGAGATALKSFGPLGPLRGIFHHNNVLNNSIPQGRPQGSNDQGASEWDDGYPSGGNFWSDYVGSDQFQGPDQDVPGSDGIGDTPYLIPEGSDRYPLMSPVPGLPSCLFPSQPVEAHAVANGSLVVAPRAGEGWRDAAAEPGPFRNVTANLGGDAIAKPAPDDGLWPDPRSPPS